MIKLAVMLKVVYLRVFALANGQEELKTFTGF